MASPLLSALLGPQVLANVTDPVVDNQPNPAAAMQPPVHKGLFGMKGTLRDIVGILGDALIAGGGGKGPIYMPQRQRERISDAMLGYQNDPQQTIATVAGLDPETATSLQRNYLEELKQKADLEEARRKEQEAKNTRILEGIAGLTRSKGAEASWSKLHPYIRDVLSRNKITLPFDIPEKYSKDFADMINNYLITPKQAADLDLDERYKTAQILLNGGKLVAETKMKQANLQQDAVEEAGRNNRASEAQAGQTERTNITQAGQDRRTGSGVSSPKAKPATREQALIQHMTRKGITKIRDKKTGKMLELKNGKLVPSSN